MKRLFDPSQIEVVDEAVAAVLRRKTPAERVAMALDMNRTARLLIEDGLRTRHPDWTDDQIKVEVAWRMLPADCRTPEILSRIRDAHK
jgi:Rv0078B-related antitoxin